MTNFSMGRGGRGALCAVKDSPLATGRRSARVTAMVLSLSRADAEDLLAGRNAAALK
jgi:hypothetical protein